MLGEGETLLYTLQWPFFWLLSLGKVSELSARLPCGNVANN